MEATRGSVAVILCAAGASNRMGGVKKEYLPLRGNSFTVLGSALNAFASSSRVGDIVIAVPPGSREEARASLPELSRQPDCVFFVEGGPTRRASVYNALSLLESRHPSHVLIHDGARPWIKPELIEKIIDVTVKFGAAIPALPLTETPKELARGEGAGVDFVQRHLRRADFCAAQTPQGFKFPEILNAHKKAAERERAAWNAGELSTPPRGEISGVTFEYTDDAEIWGEFVGRVAVIPGDPANRKITYPEDLA